MAVPVIKKRSRLSKRAEAKQFTFWDTVLSKFFNGIPAAALLMLLLFIWSSSTTIISGSIVHVCLSSRKLSNLYCLSAGAQPNIEVPVPVSTLKLSNATENGINRKILDVGIPLDPVLTSQAKNGSGKDLEIANARAVVEEQMQMHRSWISDAKHTSKNCEGRGIYVYDLPSKFNKDLVAHCADMVPWMNFCKYFQNEALGEQIPRLGKGWYQTHQYSLEPIFHSRVSKHPCRVFNQEEAKLFYVPFYGGLDVLRWHFKNASDDAKDALGLDIVNWLAKQPSWARNSGKDHVFVLGKVSWDFRRTRKSAWGTGFLEHRQMQNPTKLLIERHPWHVNDIGIPHPTHFHPSSDDDIYALQWRILQSSRKSLIAFAGAARNGSPENIRNALIKQCNAVDNAKCRFLDCDSGGCDHPELVVELFMESEFCLQPPGDSPTRKSVFDSLISGCVPVIFDPFTAYYQYPWHLPEDHGKYSMFIDQEEVRKGDVNVVERLMKVSEREREDMRKHIAHELLPGLVYGDSSSHFDNFQDAFSITMNNLLSRMSKME